LDLNAAIPSRKDRPESSSTLRTASRACTTAGGREFPVVEGLETCPITAELSEPNTIASAGITLLNGFVIKSRLYSFHC
jgi:hypothetical protein